MWGEKSHFVVKNLKKLFKIYFINTIISQNFHNKKRKKTFFSYIQLSIFFVKHFYE